MYFDRFLTQNPGQFEGREKFIIHDIDPQTKFFWRKLSEIY